MDAKPPPPHPSTPTTPPPPHTPTSPSHRWPRPHLRGGDHVLHGGGNDPHILAVVPLATSVVEGAEWPAAVHIVTAEWWNHAAGRRRVLPAPTPPPSPPGRSCIAAASRGRLSQGRQATQACCSAQLGDPQRQLHGGYAVPRSAQPTPLSVMHRITAIHACRSAPQLRVHHLLHLGCEPRPPLASHHPDGAGMAGHVAAAPRRGTRRHAHLRGR